MKKTSFIAIIIVILAMSLKAQNPVLTLDSCFALAKANNAQLKTDQMEIQKAQEVKAQVFTKYFPQVSISYLAYYAAHPIVKYGVNDIQNDELGRFLSELITALNNPDGPGLHLPTEINLMKYGQGMNATAIMPIYAGGRIKNGNQLAHLGIEAAQLKAEVSERDLLENIESSYYLVLGLQDKVNTLESALALTDSLEHIVDVALKAGLITKSDKLRLALKQNELKAKQMQLSNGIVLASQLLCQQIGIDYPETGLVLDTTDLKAMQPMLTVERENFVRPEHQLLQLQIDAEVLRRKLTFGEALFLWQPRPRLQGQCHRLRTTVSSTHAMVGNLSQTKGTRPENQGGGVDAKRPDRKDGAPNPTSLQPNGGSSVFDGVRPSRLGNGQRKLPPRRT